MLPSVETISKTVGGATCPVRCDIVQHGSGTSFGEQKEEIFHRFTCSVRLCTWFRQRVSNTCHYLDGPFG